MRKRLPMIDPVAIALDQIDTGPSIRFTGIDLETGTQVSVLVDRAAQPSTPVENLTYQAAGLVLVLSIETLKAAG